MNPNVDLRREQHRIYLGAAAAFVLCALAFGTAHVLGRQVADSAAGDLAFRLKFWAGASLVFVAWVMIGIGMVSRIRRRSAADIRGSAFAPPSPALAVPAAFLQNTLEQSFVAIVTQLALVLVVEAAALPLLVASVVLFSIGRASFLAGYPHGAGARSFGMALTAMPGLFAFLIAAGALVWQAMA